MENASQPLYNQLESYPVQYQQRQCNIPNAVMDFQIDIAKPHEKSIQLVNGPAGQLFGQEDRIYVQTAIVARWSRVAPHLVSQIQAPHKCGCCRILSFVLCCLTGGFCFCPLFCHQAAVIKRANKAAIQWRDLFIRDMQQFIQTDLSKRYPNLTFTLIYPVCVYNTLVRYQNNVAVSQRPNIANIYAYIRVSVGPLPISDSYEPTVFSSNGTVNLEANAQPQRGDEGQDDVELVTSS